MAATRPHFSDAVESLECVAARPGHRTDGSFLPGRDWCCRYCPVENRAPFGGRGCLGDRFNVSRFAFERDESPENNPSSLGASSLADVIPPSALSQ